MKDAGVTLSCLEIGNEPNFYVALDKREEGWDVNDYVDKFVVFEKIYVS